ncbi:acyltransferase [Pseudarthrobacter oxydans]|uniref:acyltransferase n=1 Tax=Pseudarthrobacter oxydans TaxID=1671 RepID=UPI003F50C8EE
MLSRIISRVRDNFDIARNPISYARRVGVQVGDDCRFLGVKRGQFGSEPYLISIGNHVTITSGTSFITHDGGVWVLRSKYPHIDVFGRITIGDNVFVGMNATLMPGVTIGGNSVVATGSVVTRDVPAGSIVAGVPARVIGTVEEYEKKSLAKALHVRGLPSRNKQAAVLAHLAELP